MHILLVEDHLDLQHTLTRTLMKRGFSVHVCDHGTQALSLWQDLVPDLVLLDLSLPGMDGLDVLQTMRKKGFDTPVILLTARGTVGDRILGLNTGADDYMAKPFDLDELEARIRALLRRHASSREPSAFGGTSEEEKKLGPLRYDVHNHAAYWNQTLLELPPRELAMLAALMQRPGKAVSKERLFGLVFAGQSDIQFEAIDVVAYRLRKKLAGTPIEVVTLRGLGYLLKLQAASAPPKHEANTEQHLVL